MGRSASAEQHTPLPPSSSSSSSSSSMDVSHHNTPPRPSLLSSSPSSSSSSSSSSLSPSPFSACHSSSCNNKCCSPPPPSPSTRTNGRDYNHPDTDLRLGLSASPNCFQQKSSDVVVLSQRELRRHDDWPPIKPHLKSTLAVAAAAENNDGSDSSINKRRRKPSLYVKVYMEGFGIGRKLDLFAHHSYKDLVAALTRMFRTTIITCPDGNGGGGDRAEKFHVLIYEDKEGDWMMVGDVPWEMFMTTVKRLKITRIDRC